MNKYLSSSLMTVVLCFMQTVAAGEFSIEFKWDPQMKECFSTRSPEISLFNVPAGTTKLSIRMKDEDSPYNHGGGKMKYNGENVIPAGTLSYWKGPCPPSQHTYTFVVTAKGGDKARASYSQKYPQ